MEKLNYSINIDASAQKVWEIMLDAEHYQNWCKAFGGNPIYQGEWIQGSHINFIDPDCGGTKARLDEVKPYERIHAVHIAVIDKDGQEDLQSNEARTWIGSTETYIFEESGSQTRLTVEIGTHPDFAKMFNEGWPKALQSIKELCEAG